MPRPSLVCLPLLASLAAPVSAQSVLRWSDGGDSPAVAKSALSSARFRLSAEARPAPAAVAGRVAAKRTEPPASLAQPSGRAATVRRSLFGALLEPAYGLNFASDAPSQDAGEPELPPNTLPGGEDALPELPGNALPGNESPPAPRKGEERSAPSRPVLAPKGRAAAPRELDGHLPPNEIPGTHGAEPRWLPLEPGEAITPVPINTSPRQDEPAQDEPGQIVPGEDEPVPPQPPLEYPYAGEIAAPLLAPPVGPRVGYEPIYPGDPWANYVAEETAHGRRGIFGWLLSLLGL
jgi:hypothetical protein